MNHREERPQIITIGGSLGIGNKEEIRQWQRARKERKGCKAWLCRVLAKRKTSQMLPSCSMSWRKMGLFQRKLSQGGAQIRWAN